MIKPERSRAARNGLPELKQYVYRGAGEDIYRGVTGRLDEVRPQPAERSGTRAGEAMPDIAPGYEWYRELAEDDGLAGLDAARERSQAALDALDAATAPPPVTAASRCGRCRYLTTAPGHEVMCGE